MAYRYGNREQMTLLPQSIEEYVESDAPVRAYDAFVESLDFEELGIEVDPDKVGNPQYDPKSMLKLLIYGYSYGTRGSRKLERETHYNLSFIWLMGGLKPDHKTISEFRRRNKGTLKKVLRQCARLCIRLGIIEGNTLFVDSTKIRANASIKNSWTKEKCERYLRGIDRHIEAILSECEAIDEREEAEDSLVRMEQELKDREVLKSRVEDIVKELKEEEKRSTNTVDSECTRINSIQGTHAGYSVEAVVDEKHGLIVSSDVVGENNDLGQFANQINQANEVLGSKCEVACADSGYANTEELEKIDKQGINVIVPSQRQASGREAKAFDKENFRYDSKRDCYICPQGHELTYRYTNNKEKSRVYKTSEGSICRGCAEFGVCTKSQEGRMITRLINEQLRQKIERQYSQPECQAIYKLRGQRVEHPFGHIKRNLKVDSFLLRGLDGVRAEMSILASCFNIARMISIIGVPALVKMVMS